MFYGTIAETVMTQCVKWLCFKNYDYYYWPAYT